MLVLTPTDSRDELELSQTINRRLSIFLAGSIEMGLASPWQDKVIKELNGKRITVYNPRRSDWDSSWIQSIDNKEFKKQVLWEQKYLKASDIIFFYIQGDTKSPITLLEFGQAIESNKTIVICCEKGFWRRGNIEVLCDSEGIELFSTLDEAVDKLFDILHKI